MQYLMFSRDFSKRRSMLLPFVYKVSYPLCRHIGISERFSLSRSAPSTDMNIIAYL